MILQQKQVANLSNHTPEPSRHFNSICYDDDDEDDYKESTIPLRDIICQLPPSIVITTSPSVLPVEDPEDSLIMGNEELSTIPKKETDKVIKSSVEDFVPIPSESEDTSGVIVSVIYLRVMVSLPLTDDESLSDENVSEDNVKICSNPLFELDDEYISSDLNPLFDEVLEEINSKASYDYNLDDPALLVTHLFDSNKDECFNPEGDVDVINAFDISSDFKDGFYDSKGDVLYLESLLSDDTSLNLPPNMYLDRDPRSFSDMNDLEIMVKVFDPGIPMKVFLQHMIAPNYEDSRARGFVHRLLELHSLASLYMGIRCSWCGGPFNGGNCLHCTNVSFGDEPVYDSNLNSYNQTSNFSNPPLYHNYMIYLRSDTGAAFQAEFAKLQQNFEQFMDQQSCSYYGGPFNGGNCPSCSIVGAGNEFVHDPNPFPYNNRPDFYDQLM
nr:hypothetical protein [Tanacetum cinerariifolium]